MRFHTLKTILEEAGNHAEFLHKIDYDAVINLDHTFAELSPHCT